MRVDAWTLRAVAGELAALLTGARIDPIIAPTPHAVAMVCYRDGQNRWLLISAHPQLGRVHLLPAKPPKLVAAPSTFVMLLRKYVEGARIQAIRAVPWERVIEIDARLGGPEGQTVTLIAEIMGNLGNIILVDADRMILGALHHVSHQVNRYRAISPGQPYLPPPPQTRLVAGVTVPRLLAPDLTAANLGESLATDATPGPLWKALMTQIAGLSPDIAQEAVCRALGDPQATVGADVAPVAAALRDLAIRAERDDWQPTAILNGAGEVADGALWPPCMGAERPQRPAESVNDLLATLFAAREWGASIDTASGELRRMLKTARDRLTKKRAVLQGELDALRAADGLRHEGELLLAFATDIPEGATSFAVPDLGDGAPPHTITLDPQRTAIENANARFTRYHKMRRAAEAIPPQLAATEVALARVAQLATDLDLADTLADLTHVRAEVAEARLGAKEQPEAAPKKKKPSGGKPGQKGKTPPKPRMGGDPLRFTAPDGQVIYVGKNSHQNEYVTFDLGTGGDTWLHARGVPGAHVIIKAGGRPVSPETLAFAAGLAAWFSQSRTAGSVPIDYTEQRLVRHIKDGGPGMVTYSKERTLPAAPRDPASQR